MTPKVLVSGCFDMLHSGHIAFLREAAQYGDVYVALGSDKTVMELKGRPPINTQDERLFMMRSVAYVRDAFISGGSGIIDYQGEMEALMPDRFIVNADGHTPQKQALCEALGIEYIVLQRKPHADLPPRSTTALRQLEQMPYRIDLAGGWLDQPFVSKHHPGPVITISLEPTIEFNERSGMASSTRRSAIELWGPVLPVDNHEKLARILFCYDNPPGTEEISGSQDAIGIVFPGLNKANYEGSYWPSSIESVQDEETLQFIERHLYLVSLGPRRQTFSVLSGTRFDAARAKRLADAANDCWQAIRARDAARFGRHVRESFEAQVAMFPNMMIPDLPDLIDRYRHIALGWKLSGAGGGGYLILVSEREIENAIQIVIRRGSY